MLTKKKFFASLTALLLVLNLLSPMGSVFASSTDVLTVAEAIANNSGTATVEGYIVGTTQTTSVFGSGTFENFTIRTNVLIADNPNERDMSKIIPVQLPNNAIRTAVNLVDNPENLGKKVRVTGDLAAYFGVPGIRNLTASEFVSGDDQEDPIDDRDYVTVAEAIENNTGRATVKGYIVGTRNVFDGPFTVTTNIQIADSPYERDLAKTIPVQLPIGAVRNALNLVDNPQNLGKLVKITGDLAAYFSSPGLRNASDFEFVVGGEVPTPVTPVVTIAEARGMLGQTVITEGIVNVDNGLLQPGRLSVYIQDGNAGVQLFNFSPWNFPTLEEGDRVKVEGRVGEFNGVTQINVEELVRLERNEEVVVKEVTIADYANTNLAESYEGQLVTLEGYIFAVPDYSSGGVNITIIDEALNVLTIRAWESTGIDLSQIESNKWYQVTAISSEYRGTYQILPRSNADFALSPVQKAKPFGEGTEVRATVERVVDGDTVRLAHTVFGASNVRFLNIDTLETYHTVRNELDENQMRLGKRAGDHLRTMIADGDEVILRLGEEPLDGYGRLLAEVITLDGVNTNYEMVLAGEAVTYFIWPFEHSTVAMYGEALKFARENQLGIWNPEDPMLEYPFEFRARERGEEPKRPVGDYRTKFYVAASEWQTVAPEYRVFFNSEEDALTAGYMPKPVGTKAVMVSLKEVVIELFNSNEIYKNSTYNVLVNQIDTIENHLEKAEEATNPRAAEAHETNLYRAIEKLNRDVEREFNNGNLSQNAYKLILEYIEMSQVHYAQILNPAA